MTYVETPMNVWEALAGRAPGEPSGPADPGLWGAVVDRLNTARARPVLSRPRKDPRNASRKAAIGLKTPYVK